MSKSNTLENDWLKLLFNATAIANIADNAASSPLANLYVALHTANPGEAGSQTTSECAYGSYARVAVARTAGGFTVTANSVSPVAVVDFPECTSGSEEATFFSIGTASSGAGIVLYYGVIGAAPTMVTGATSDTITSPGHGLAVNDRCVFLQAFGLTVPAGITAGTVYYVKTAPDADTFTISTTQGGATLDITASGQAIVQRVTPISISSGTIPRLKTTSAITED